MDYDLLKVENETLILKRKSDGNIFSCIYSTGDNPGEYKFELENLVLLPNNGEMSENFLAEDNPEIHIPEIHVPENGLHFNVMELENQAEVVLVPASQVTNEAKLPNTVQAGEKKENQSEVVPVIASQVTNEANLPNTVQDGEKKTWTTPETKLLLTEYQLKVADVGKGKMKKMMHLWESLAEELRKKNHRCTAKQAEDRFKSLKRSFFGVNKHNKRTGRDRMDAEVAGHMEAIFEKKDTYNARYVIGKEGCRALAIKSPEGTSEAGTSSAGIGAVVVGTSGTGTLGTENSERRNLSVNSSKSKIIRTATVTASNTTLQEELLAEQEVDDPQSAQSTTSPPSSASSVRKSTSGGKGTTANNVARCTVSLGVINDQIIKKTESQRDFQEKILQKYDDEAKETKHFRNSLLDYKKQKLKLMAKLLSEPKTKKKKSKSSDSSCDED